MHLVIDTSGMTFTVGSDFEPVLDFETKQPKADRATGAMLAKVQLIALFKDYQGRPRSEILTVKLPDPTPLPAGSRYGWPSWSPTPGARTAAAGWPTGRPRSSRPCPSARRAEFWM
jgi:hypothetical protein